MHFSYQNHVVYSVESQCARSASNALIEVHLLQGCDVYLAFVVRIEQVRHFYPTIVVISVFLFVVICGDACLYPVLDPRVILNTISNVEY